MATQGPKPYIKLAFTLVAIGGGLLSLERMGLGQWVSPSHRLDGNLLTVLFVVPVALIAAGAIVFMVGKMRRL